MLCAGGVGEETIVFFMAGVIVSGVGAIMLVILPSFFPFLPSLFGTICDSVFIFWFFFFVFVSLPPYQQNHCCHFPYRFCILFLYYFTFITFTLLPFSLFSLLVVYVPFAISAVVVLAVIAVTAVVALIAVLAVGGGGAALCSSSPFLVLFLRWQKRFVQRLGER